MIVCSCNVFTDHDVRNAVSVAQMPPRTPGQIYGCLGCSAQCGRCARTIKKIMDEALGACAKSCCSGCPHSQIDAETAGPGRVCAGRFLIPKKPCQYRPLLFGQHGLLSPAI